MSLPGSLRSARPFRLAPGATVVDGAGRTLMPGLIDAHWHTILVRPTPAQAIYGDVGLTNLVAGHRAPAGARAADAGRKPDQAHGRQR